MEVEKVLHMNDGQGDSSYSRNSYYQEISLRFLEPFLQESISRMKILHCERFCIADLGCAAGPNTLFVAETITNAVRRKYIESGSALGNTCIPEFQVFFSDLPSNDFNLVFRSIPPFIDRPQENNRSQGYKRTRSYFAAGVPGSFHRRLFPRNSLHFVHSSYSLHWLSQVPIEIEDKTSMSWNRGKVFISTHGAMEVARAYLGQFQKDFNSFLIARAQEIVPGGHMFLYLSGRTASDPSDQGASGIIGQILDDAFNDMVLEGLIHEDKRDSFNLPFFAPSAKELEDEVEKEGSFIIKRIQFLSGVVEAITNGDKEETKQMIANNEANFGEMLAKQFRAILESLIASHFGEEVIDELFKRFAKGAIRKMHELLKSNHEGGGILAILERA